MSRSSTSLIRAKCRQQLPTVMGLKVVQINLHHCKAASANLCSFLMEEGIQIALIQEPWINANKICGLNLDGYHLFYLKEGVSKHRSCILASKKLEAFIIPSLCTGDTTSVKLERPEGDIVLVSSYMAHEYDAPPSEIDLISQHCKQERLQVVIGCDANSHHSQWGSSDINERGESLFEFILKEDFSICNIGDCPTFVTKGRAEVLDVTLSSLVQDSIESWRVSEKHSFSDHRLITFEINRFTEPQACFKNVRKTDWSKFNSLMESKLNISPMPTLLNESEIDECVEEITNMINSCFSKCCPTTRIRRKKHPPWWSHEITELRKSARKQFNKARKSGNEDDWSLYKSKLRLFKSAIRKSKQDSWSKFCESIESTSETSRLRKILSKSDTAPSYIMNNEGQWTSSSLQTLKVLVDTHFPGCTDALCDSSNFPKTPSQLSMADQASIDECIITEEKVLWALSTFKPYKSPGPDGLIPAMLQHCGQLLAPRLCLLYRSCLKLNYVPKEWRRVSVVFIPKAGKPSHCKPKDFRPISLSSFLLKSFERLLDIFIRESIPKENISSSQHAYTKGKSVETALHDVVHTIEKTFSCQQFTLGVFLDIEGAFNNIHTGCIKQSLQIVGLPSYMVNWIGAMLNNRTIQSKLGSSVISKHVSRGTPQGGVLSPLLWNLSLNKILIRLSALGVKVVAYADDLVLLVSGFDLGTIRDLMQNCLNILFDWAKGCGLNVNPSKTEVVLFTKNQDTDMRDLTIDGIPLKMNSKANFLGVILDSKLTWKDNMENRVKKATNALYVCKKSFGKRWGLKPKLIHWIYTAVARPILTYGCVVWWTCLRKSTYLGKFEKVQRLSCLYVTGARRSTPTRAMETMLNLIRLDIYCQGSAAKSALRLNSSGLWKGRPYGHGDILNLFQVSSTQTTDYQIASLNFNRIFKINIPTRTEWEEGYLQDSTEAIYTDGSKMECGVGAGVYSESLSISESYSLNNHCSIFQAEVFAIYKAACIVESMNHVNKRFVICVDSQAAIKALFASNINSKIVWSCAQILKQLASRCEITLCWVPGHSGVKGNDMADELARTGAQQSNIDQVVECPLQQLKTNIDKVVITKHNQHWKSSEHHEVSKALYPILDYNRTQHILSLDKDNLRTLVGVITGHTQIGSFLSKFVPNTSDECRSCKAIDSTETIFHFLCECPSLRRRRQWHMGQFFFDDLEELCSINLENLLGFIKSTGWF